MSPASSSPFRDYGIALLATVVAVGVRWLVDPWVGDFLPLATLFGAVAVAVWSGGVRPALLACVLGYLACHFLFVQPRGGLRLTEARDVFGLGLYVVSSAVIIGFGHDLRISRRRAEASRRESLRKQALLEEALAARRKHEADLHLVTNAMSAPVARCSRALRYEWVSKPYARWLGRTPEEIVGQRIVDVLGRDAFERLRPSFERVLAGEEVRYEDEINFSGLGPRWISAVYTPVRDGGGIPDGWVAVVLDVDQRKRGEQALQEADRRKDEFLAVLAHELRNPLAPIRNAVQVLRIRGPAEPILVNARDVIDRQVQHLTRLVDDLLDVSRISRAQIALRRERVSLELVVASAVEVWRPSIEAAGLTLAVLLPDEPVFLDADLTRLSQVLQNLLGNAVKFTRPGGRIELAARRAAQQVVLSVRDTGIGIPADMLGAIFEPFMQVDRSLERATGGLGIGLTVAQRLLALHGGTIEARSAGPGQGSEFLLCLPAANERGTLIPRAPRPTPARAAAPLRVLVADDNRDAAESLAMLLRCHGHEVHTAHDGLEVLRVGAEIRPQLVVLDLGMPGLNGYECCRRLRAEPWGKSLRIVALTGWGQEEDRQRSRAAGFDGHMVKPLDEGALTKLLDEHLASS